MQKATLKIKDYTTTIFTIESLTLRINLFKSLMVGFLLCAMLYLVFIASIVLGIVERNNYENKIRSLSTEVSELELAYLEGSASIDLEYSYSLGFEQVEKQFATRRQFSMGDLKLAKNEI